MSTALATIADRVRERVRREGVALSVELADRYVREEVRGYSERALGGSLPLLPDEADATRQVIATLTGFGALQPLLDDPEVEELWINAPDGTSATMTSDDLTAPNCPKCLEPMEPDDGAWSWRCTSCDTTILPGERPGPVVPRP